MTTSSTSAEPLYYQQQQHQGNMVISNPHQLQPMGTNKSQQQCQELHHRTSILVFSAINIALGIISISIQIATIVLVADTYYLYVSEFDYVGTGIWGGIFYIVAGSLGIAASCKNTRPLLVSTVVMTSIGLAASFVAIVLTAITAGKGYYPTCEAWLGLEWSLMAFSILVFINSIVLLSLTSIETCCKKNVSGNKVNMNNGFAPVVIVNGQPMYLQPAPAAHQGVQNGAFVLNPDAGFNSAVMQPQQHQQYSINPSVHQQQQQVPSGQLPM